MNYKLFKDFIILLLIALGLYLGFLGIIVLTDFYKIDVSDNFSRVVFAICLIVLITALFLSMKLFKKKLTLIEKFSKENGFKELIEEKIPSPIARKDIEIKFIVKKEEDSSKIYIAGLNWELGLVRDGSAANPMNQRFFGAFIGETSSNLPKIELTDLNLHKKLINLIPRHTFESIEFNNRFYFSSDDVKSSYEIITPDFMAEILDLNLREFSLSIKNGYAQLLFEHFDDQKILSDTLILFKKLLSKLKR